MSVRTNIYAVGGLRFDPQLVIEDECAQMVVNDYIGPGLYQDLKNLTAVDCILIASAAGYYSCEKEKEFIARSIDAVRHKYGHCWLSDACDAGD